MHIHLPRPLHGWREFLGEVGVIVLGVLIALGLEQAAEAYHSSERTRASRQAIATEVRFNLAKANRELEMRDCMERQLGAVADAIGKGSHAQLRLRLNATRLVTPFPWSDAAWRAAVASDTADHFDPVLRRKYSVIYGTEGAASAAQEQYLDAYLQLRSTALSGLVDSSAASATEVSQMARLSAATDHLLEAAREFKFTAKDEFGFESTNAEMAAIPEPRGELERCQVAASAMARSGQA